MARRALIRIVQGEFVAIASDNGGSPSGELHLAARRALHSAQARAGGELDVIGRDDCCLERPTDAHLAIGIMACSLLGDGYIVELHPGSVPFEDVP